MKEKQTLNVKLNIPQPIEAVWKTWTTPGDIQVWNVPFPDWHCPNVENDLREGGFFSFRMEKIDGSEGFDHAGYYDAIIEHKLIEYTGLDNRKSVIEFVENENITTITETFEPEENTPFDLQKDFCQLIHSSFKKYIESKFI
jgi:uncharacterized protein YndB with AHSA1/START domain